MATVIGIPLLKGNSQVLISCHMRDLLVDLGPQLSGRAVALQGNNSVEPNVTTLDDPSAKGFYGFIVEVNKCSNKCTVLRAAESVSLLSDGTSPAGGEQVLIDPATGLISATGTVAIAGTIINGGGGTLTAKFGQTGEDAPDPVLINLSVSPVFAAPIAAASKAKSDLTPTK